MLAESCIHAGVSSLVVQAAMGLVQSSVCRRWLPLFGAVSGMLPVGGYKRIGMAVPEAIVARYRAMPFGTDALGDCSENDAKVNLLADLDEHANSELVAALLLDVLAATDEFDLARIEAAKIVGLYVDDRCPLETQLKTQLWKIVANTNDDTLVRQLASQHIEAGFRGASEKQIVERLLFDDDDDIDVRHGALIYAQTTPDVSFSRMLLPRLRAHDYWQGCTAALANIASR